MMVDAKNYMMLVTNSSIHNLNRANKVLLALFMMLFIVIANSNMDLFMVNLLLLVLLSWSNISYREVLKNISLFGVFIFLIIFVISLVSLNLYLGFFWLLKTIDVIVLLSLVGMTSSFYDLVSGSRFLLRPFRFIIDINWLSIKIGIFFKFMSIMYVERNRIEASKRYRGMDFDKMNFIDRIDLILKEIGLIFKFSIIRVKKLKTNLFNNRFGVDFSKYKYRLNKWTKTDTILLIVNVFMLFVIFMY